MKISEWFSDEMRRVRNGGIIEIEFYSKAGRKNVAETTGKLSKLEALRDEALRLEALDNARVATMQ